MTGAGNLRDALVLESKTQTPSGATGMTVAYTEVAHVWGEVRGVRYAEFVAAVQTSDAATHTIRIRWRARYDFDHVSGDAGRRWRLVGIRDPDNKRRWLDLFALELSPEAA